MKTLNYMWKNRYRSRCANIPFTFIPNRSTYLNGQEQVHFLYWEFPIPFYQV